MGNNIFKPSPPPPPPPPPAPPAPPALPVPATAANVQPSLFTSRAYNTAGESVFNNVYQNTGVLVDTNNLNNCMNLANNDPYSMNNCILTYVKGIDQNNSTMINLTKGNTNDTFNNIEKFSNCNTLSNDYFSKFIIISFILLLLFILCKK
jgi:hypothetical protein